MLLAPASRLPICNQSRDASEFWEAKFSANVERDRRNEQALLALGWRVAVVWGCAATSATLAATAERLAGWLRSPDGEDRLELGEADVNSGMDQRAR